MDKEAYGSYPVDVYMQIDDGPVLGYHILMATWTAARMYEPEPVLDPGVEYRILAKQSTRRVMFMVHAGNMPINPRDDYKDFVVSSCYNFESTRPNPALFREAAESFGADILLQLAKQRLLEPPALERYICPYSHEGAPVPVFSDKLCTWNEKTGGYDCALDGYISPGLIVREFVEVFEKK